MLLVLLLRDVMITLTMACAMVSGLLSVVSLCDFVSVCVFVFVRLLLVCISVSISFSVCLAVYRA